MKTPQMVASLLGLLVISTVSAGALAPDAAPTPELLQLINEGKAAYQHGDIQKAKADFQMVYQIDPRNQLAIGYLRRIKADEKYTPRSVDQEAALSAIVVPKVEFRDATMREALDTLRKKVSEISNGKQSVNFVVPVGAATDALRVTLSLQNVPFPEAVRYIGRVTNYKFTFEKYAIVGTPLSGGATVAEPAPTILQGAKSPTVAPQ